MAKGGRPFTLWPPGYGGKSPQLTNLQVESMVGFEPASSRECPRVCFLKAPHAHIAATSGRPYSQMSGILPTESVPR